MADALAFHPKEELPADLALDLRLHELLEHSLQATAATGAVIALASGDKMVCRATLGEKAPKTGVFVNTRSGLSGLCVQTRELQRCEDALTDPRVNTDACRALDIRSIVVLPILDGKKLWGILEVFSTGPRAFNDADVRTLQALGCKVSDTVHEAVEGGTLSPISDKWPNRPKQDLEPRRQRQFRKSIMGRPEQGWFPLPPQRCRIHGACATAGLPHHCLDRCRHCTGCPAGLDGRPRRLEHRRESGRYSTSCQLRSDAEARRDRSRGIRKVSPSAVVEYPAASYDSEEFGPVPETHSLQRPKAKSEDRGRRRPGCVRTGQGSFPGEGPVRKSSPLPAGTDPAAMRTEVTPEDTSADEAALISPHANAAICWSGLNRYIRKKRGKSIFRERWC